MSKKPAPTSWRTKMRMAAAAKDKAVALVLRKQAAAQRKRERTIQDRRETNGSAKKLPSRREAIRRLLKAKEKLAADQAGGWSVERRPSDGAMIATHSSAPNQTQLERNLLRMFGAKEWEAMTPEDKAAAEIQMKAVMDIAEATGRSAQARRDANEQRIRNVAAFLSVYRAATDNPKTHDRTHPWIISPFEVEAIVATLEREGYTSSGYRSPTTSASMGTDNAKS